MGSIFADVLESTREPGTSRFSTSGVADILGLQQQDLAALAGVHRNTLRTHPESPRLQSALRDLMRVLSAATAVQPDPQRAGRAKGQSILVTGSARLDAFRQAGESLAGRYFSWHLLPVTVHEFVTATDITPEDALNRLLERGGFP